MCINIIELYIVNYSKTVVDNAISGLDIDVYLVALCLEEKGAAVESHHRKRLLQNCQRQTLEVHNL